MKKNYWKDYFEEKARHETDIYKRVGFVSSENTERVRHHVRNLIAENGQDHLILDAGCGDGLVMRPFAENNKVIGLDFSPNMLEHAKNNGLIPVCGDLSALPFHAQSFDRIVSVEAVTLLDDPYDSLAGMGNCLKKNGVLVLSALNSHSLLRKIAELFYIVFLRRAVPATLNIKKIKSILAQEKIEIQKIILVYCFPFFTFETKAQSFLAFKLLFANNMIIQGQKNAD